MIIYLIAKALMSDKCLPEPCLRVPEILVIVPARDRPVDGVFLG
jgi:hypothetical protein